ncbi:MAG: redoxin domain-containing protein [Bacteroidales bacterium]|nr:redoxin domain-containing protein [Bacteroidales bacterium]
MNPRNITRPLLSWGVVAILTLAATGCRDKEFKVAGTLAGAEKEKIILEKADYSGRWQTVDSTRTDSNGNFSISHIAPSSPEIYRIGAGDEWVYIPVDSTETITVNGDLKGFGTHFSLSGSDQALQMEKFEKEVHALGLHPDAKSLEEFRRGVYTRYLQNARGAVMSYYILTKTVDGRPLFDTADPDAARYVAAVASSFKQFRPDDPRTRLLEAAAREGLRRRQESKGVTRTVQAEQIGYLDITLPDENGRETSLSEVAGKGTKTLLVFTLMNQADSPEFNRHLRQLASTRGLSVYHVSLDADQYEWREGARNLPWTTVYDPEGAQSSHLLQYNVRTLPTVFVIDGSGQITARVEDISELPSAL